MWLARKPSSLSFARWWDFKLVWSSYVNTELATHTRTHRPTLCLKLQSTRSVTYPGAHCHCYNPIVFCSTVFLHNSLLANLSVFFYSTSYSTNSTSFRVISSCFPTSSRLFLVITRNTTTSLLSTYLLLSLSIMVSLFFSSPYQPTTLSSTTSCYHLPISLLSIE